VFSVSADAFGTLLIVVGAVLGVALLGLSIFSLVWVYRDAEVRGKTGCMWLLIAFFTWPLGVLAYFLLREKPVQL
jgi:hypothetical protein